MTSDSVPTKAASRPHERERLSGNMGVTEVAMSVLAFSSPLTTVAGFLPVLILFAGNTAPVLYLLQTAVMLIFAVGLVAMSRTVKNPGGFYAFISAGLGRAAGMGGAALSLFGYLLIGFFGAPFFGQTMQTFVRDAMGGPDIPWWVYGIGVVVITTILAYNKIDLSAKVLVIIMVLEIIAVIVFNIFAIGNGVSNNQSAAVAFPSLGSASIGLALLFSASNFLGFEATVMYRDEVKDPDKTIPRATYLAVAGIGLFYAFAAWAFIIFLGADNAQAAAEEALPWLILGGIIVTALTTPNTPEQAANARDWADAQTRASCRSDYNRSYDMTLNTSEWYALTQNPDCYGYY